MAAGAVGALLDLTAARRGAAEGPVGVVRHHGCASYAPLVVARVPAGDGSR